MKITCPVCAHHVQVWADKSDGLKVNFACDNPDCAAGKGPWDTPRPDDPTDEQIVSELLADVRNGVYG